MRIVLKITALLVCMALVFVTACQKKAEEKAAEKAMEKSIEKETGQKAKVEVNKKKIVVEQEGGKAEIAREGSVELPEGFPKDIYVYPGAKVLMSFTPKGGTTVTLATNDDLSDVAASYKEEMTKKGWSLETSMKMQQMQMFGYKKGNREVTVQIMPASSQMAPGAEKAKTIIGIVVNTEG